MKQFTTIALFASSLWMSTVNAESPSPERLQTLRVTGMIVPYEAHLRDAFRTVSILVNDKPWLFRISDAKALTDGSDVVPDILKDESLLKDIRFTGPDALMRRLQKAHQLGRFLTIEGQFDAKVDKTGERWFEAELYRLKGQLMLRSQVKSPKSKVKEAEGCFLKAIEITQRQQAKSLELRATMSLARLWQQQDKRREAHQLLAEIYSWFTEGFNTEDLQEAKALLELLA